MASAAFTLNHGPNTSFMAIKAIAIPQLPARNSLRDRPSARLRSADHSRNSISTLRCSGVCGVGKYSSLETICVGMGS